jgi:hypothetical protein
MSLSPAEMKLRQTCEAIVGQADRIGLALPAGWSPLNNGLDVLLAGLKTLVGIREKQRTGIPADFGAQYSETNPDMPAAPNSAALPLIVVGLKKLGVVLPDGWTFATTGAADILLAAVETAAAKKDPAERQREETKADETADRVMGRREAGDKKQPDADAEYSGAVEFSESDDSPDAIADRVAFGRRRPPQTMRA